MANSTSEIEKAMSEIKMVDSISAQLVMAEAYEQAYHLFDHDRDSGRTPFSVVAMHAKERYAEMSPLHRIFRTFNELKIADEWKISITEFLQLPREFTDLMFKITKAKIVAQQPIIDQAVKDMKAMAGGR